jgi:hypothetical protein
VKLNLETSNVATILVVIYAVVGGVLVILSAIGHPDLALRLSFASYLSQMAIAVGGLAVGRGIASHGKTEPEKRAK